MNAYSRLQKTILAANAEMYEDAVHNGEKTKHLQLLLSYIRPQHRIGAKKKIASLEPTVRTASLTIMYPFQSI